MASRKNHPRLTLAPDPDALQKFAKELTENPIGIPAPFPPDLSRKPLMGLVAEHLRDAEIEDLWCDARTQPSRPEAAERAQKLFDTHLEIQSGNFHNTPEEKRAVTEFIETLNKKRILPLIKEEIQKLASGTKPGKKLSRIELLATKAYLQLGIPIARETFENIIQANRMAEEIDSLPWLGDFSKGVERFFKAHIEPSSAEQLINIGQKSPRSQEEMAHLIEQEAKEILNRKTVTLIAGKALEAMGKLEKLLATGIGHAHL